MSLPSSISGAYGRLSSATLKEIPAGLELISPTGDKFRTVDAAQFGAEGLSQTVRLQRVDRSTPVENGAGLIPQVHVSEWWFHHKAQAALPPPRSMTEIMDAAMADVLASQTNRHSEKSLMAAFDSHPLIKSLRRKVIPTGSPAVAEKLPVWEANARVVLAGAKRWAQQRWGRL